MPAECKAFCASAGSPFPFGVSFSPIFLHEQKNRVVEDKTEGTKTKT